MTLDPQHVNRGSMRSLVACVALCLAEAPSCAPAPEVMDAEVGVTQQRQSVTAAAPFTVFASGQVRPLALSPDKQQLFAVNTPDNRLEIFRVKANRLSHTGSIPVGLEPVAVAARTDREVWVVNHLSDSVSVIDLDDDARAGHVARTLLVGDEPRDIPSPQPLSEGRDVR